jgi:metal-responsive CopG/Arc/MetJ family transcriptional regulator
MKPKSEIGRPPIGDYVRFLVQLPPDMVARIKAVAGTHKRSEFIREAVSRELARRERKG